MLHIILIWVDNGFNKLEFLKNFTDDVFNTLIILFSNLLLYDYYYFISL